MFFVSFLHLSLSPTARLDLPGLEGTVCFPALCFFYCLLPNARQGQNLGSSDKSTGTNSCTHNIVVFAPEPFPHFSQRPRSMLSLLHESFAHLAHPVLSCKPLPTNIIFPTSPSSRCLQPLPAGHYLIPYTPSSPFAFSFPGRT